MAELDEYLDFAVQLAKKARRPARSSYLAIAHLCFVIQAGEMIKSGQAERMKTMAATQTKASPVDVSASNLYRLPFSYVQVCYSFFLHMFV